MEETRKKSNGIGLKFLVCSASIIVILAGLKASQTLTAPFLLAVFFAMVLLPPLRWLKQKGLSDWVSILVLSTLVLLIGFGIVSILSSSLTSFAKRLPVYQEKLGATLKMIDDGVNDLIGKFDLMEQSIEESVSEFVPARKKDDRGERAEPDTLTEQGIEPAPEPSPEERENGVAKTDTETGPQDAPGEFSIKNIIQLDTLMTYVQGGVKELLNIATVSFLVAVMVIFILVEASQMPAKVRAAFGGRDLSSEYFNRIAEDTWKYTKIKTIVSLLTGIATWIGLWFLGVEYSLLWGLLMFFLNYIPNIGPIIASIPPILLALVDQGVTMSLVVTGWLVFVNFAFGYGIEPRYLGEGLGISDLVVLLSLIFWGWLLGPIGMFLSAPLTMVLKIVLQNDPKTRWIALLLSNRIRPEPS